MTAYNPNGIYSVGNVLKGKNLKNLTHQERILSWDDCHNAFENAKDDERIAVVKTALKDVSGEFTVFDIKALLDSAVVQPNGKVKISLPIPDGYGEDVALYYISDDGVAQKLESTVNDDGSISTELDHFSMYAICKLSAEPGENSGTEQIPIWVYIAIAAVLLAGIITVILVFSKKKRA